MHKILVVEDSLEVQLLIRGTFGPEHTIIFVSTFNEAIASLEATVFDLILIDIGLPDGDGFQLCSTLKSSVRTQKIPVIFLTSRSNLRDKLLGFSVGAEDYILKPFEPLELRARVQAKLRKTTQHDQVIQRGSLRLNTSFQKAYLCSPTSVSDLGLTPIEFRLLSYFLGHENHVLSRGQLLQAGWGTNVSLSERVVDVHIHSLRKKMEDLGGSIKSVFAEGYRFSLEDNAIPRSSPDLGTY